MAGGGGESSEYEVNINLTALLDVLTNLLFFLMLGMAAQSSNMELDGGVTLPNSTSESQPIKPCRLPSGSAICGWKKSPSRSSKAAKWWERPRGASRRCTIS